ncbi:MAG TPA: hypothetical protein VGM88_08250 [Kofleriaceae bacterium]|jgi:hypothetical protein
MNRFTLSIFVAVAAAGSIASAAPREICVPSAFGVPTRPGGPDWTTPAASGGDNTLNDPRWNNASALSFVVGSAGEMLHGKQLWSQEAGGTFLYLSFVSDLTSTPGAARDVFLSFHRATIDGHATTDPGDDEHGYIFQFHLGDTGTTDTAVSLPFCGKYSQCSADTDWYRVFRDVGGTSTSCPNTGGIAGEQYIAWNGADVHTAPPELAWIASTSVAVWKEPGTGVSLQDANRWGVQVKLKMSPSTTWVGATHYNVGDVVENPIALGSTTTSSYECTTAGTSAAVGMAGPTGTGSVTDNTVTWKQVPAISEGLPQTARWWFEATEATSATYFSFAKFPQSVLGVTSGVQTSVCVTEGIQDFLVHTELGDASAGCAGCNADNFAKLVTYPAFTPPPAGCDLGLDLESQDIGSIHSTTAPGDGVAPLNEFLPGDNWLVARVSNLSAAPIDVPLSATFRLANWGSTGLDTPGSFDAIPGTENGVCAVGSEPSCTGSFSIAGGAKKSIKFDWNADATTICSYAGGVNCQPCTCDGSDPSCATGTAGIEDKTALKCTAAHYEHECMYVELKAPGGGVTFNHSSAYTNMNFASMSSVAQTALLDARSLPKQPGQQYQDIWFIVQPRNLPASLPAGSTTQDIERSASLQAAGRIAQPYVQDMAKQSEERLALVRAKLVASTHPMTRDMLSGTGEFGGQTYNGDLAHGTPDDKLAQQIVEALAIMGAADAQRVGEFLLVSKDTSVNAQYARDAVMTLGSVDASRVVPTLDIYPFYKPFDRGNVVEPMASFTLFLSHEATAAGYTWAIDGATQVSPNLYHVRIPLGFARKIQVRAQALVPPEAAELPGNPRWPCAGCCGKNCGLVGGIGNGTPGLLAALWAWGRRRRKRAAAQV